MSQQPAEILTTAHTEAAMVKALATIARHWGSLLTPETTGDNNGGGASASVVNGLDHRISLSQEATRTLGGWARIIVAERHLSHALPLAGDTPAVVALLERHARWFSGHTRARRAMRDMEKIADRVEAVALGDRISRIQVGNCPEFIWWTGDDGNEQLTHCTGTLWATLHRADTLLPKQIVCDVLHEHTWEPHEWVALGRRITPPTQASTA